MRRGTMSALKWLATAAGLVAATTLATPGPSLAQEKDYLSGLEADKIRDAQTSIERVKLFLAFATDRTKKIQYELDRASRDRMWAERLRGLLNAFASCVDDAADTLEGALEKQEDIRPAIKEMQARTKEFQAFLEKLPTSKPEMAQFKDVIDDAVLSIKEAIQTTEKVAKQAPPPPARRKP